MRLRASGSGLRASGLGPQASGLAVAAVVALVAGAGAGGAGCTPEYRYPDLSGPERTFRTFEEAWRAGDVEVLERCYTGLLLVELKAQIEKNGRDAVRAWYVHGSERAGFANPTLYHRGERVAYLRADLVTSGDGEGDGPGPTANPVRFSFAKVGGEWKISNKSRGGDVRD